MAQMRTIGTSLDRGYREDLNFNFSKLESMVTSATNLSDEMRQEFLLKIADLQSQINSLNVQEILSLISQMEQAVINANTAATKADMKAIYAEEKGNYAKEQGDYAKSQGMYAKEKGDYANEKAILANEAAALAQQESANLGQMKGDVVKATQDANIAAQGANEATVATQQVTEEAQIVIDNTGSVGAFVLATSYKKNNIVEENGSSWIAKIDTQNNPLPILPSIENTWWRLVAQKGATGEQGNSFTVNAQGLLSERSNYDSELEGFSFLATDVGELYFRQGSSDWSDGIPFGKGEPGLDGRDGTTYYTWIKYADTDKGVGMTDAPAGKKYMGIAYNKTTATKSNVASDYAWSLIQGGKGDPGTTTWEGITDKPNEFNPRAHTHEIAEVNGLQTALEGISPPDASTSIKGVVKLNNSVTSTNDTDAATPKAVKTAMDRADAAFTQANNGKSTVASAIGSPATASNTFVDLANHINDSRGEIARNLTAKGITSSGSETLNALAKKIANITVGTTGKKFASGTVTRSSSTTNYTNSDGGLIALYTVTVSGLTFLPSVIVVWNNSGFVTTTYVRNLFSYYSIAADDQRGNFSLATTYTIRDVSPVSITSSGFSLPIRQSNAGAVYDWIAYE